MDNSILMTRRINLGWPLKTYMRLIGFACLFLWAGMGVADKPVCPCWDENLLNDNVAALLAEGFRVSWCDEHPDGTPASPTNNAGTNGISSNFGFVTEVGLANAFVTLRCGDPACNGVQRKCGTRNVPFPSPLLLIENIRVDEAIACQTQLNALCRSVREQ